MKVVNCLLFYYVFDDANFPFVNRRCHLEESMPFVINIYTVKRIRTELNQVAGVVVVYRARMLAVTDSKHGNSFLFSFCFLLLFSFFL